MTTNDHFYEAKSSYSEGPIEEVKIVDDFLPPPEELIFREETVKITLALSKASVEFFKLDNTVAKDDIVLGHCVIPIFFPCHPPHLPLESEHLSHTSNLSNSRF